MTVMAHVKKLTEDGESICSKCFYDWPCPEAEQPPVTEHDRLCPYKEAELAGTFCGWCRIARAVRDDTRREMSAEAQRAVARVPLREATDDGLHLAVVWRDGWNTGYDEAVNSK